jgi:hypothetical protein
MTREDFSTLFRRESLKFNAEKRDIQLPEYGTVEIEIPSRLVRVVFC